MKKFLSIFFVIMFLFSMIKISNVDAKVVHDFIIPTVPADNTDRA